MHHRVVYPICKYISPRPNLLFSLNNNTNIPVCVCYDRSYRVSILLATRGFHGWLWVSPSAVSQSCKEQRHVNKRSCIHSRLRCAYLKQCKCKLLHFQPSCKHVLVLRSDSIFWSPGFFDDYFNIVIKLSTLQTSTCRDYVEELVDLHSDGSKTLWNENELIFIN